MTDHKDRLERMVCALVASGTYPPDCSFTYEQAASYLRSFDKWHDASAPVTNPWQAWGGGGRPTDAAIRAVDIIFRNGVEYEGINPQSVRWDHFGLDTDIMYWRPSKCGPM